MPEPFLESVQAVEDKLHATWIAPAFDTKAIFVAVAEDAEFTVNRRIFIMPVVGQAQLTVGKGGWFVRVVAVILLNGTEKRRDLGLMLEVQVLPAFPTGLLAFNAFRVARFGLFRLAEIPFLARLRLRAVRPFLRPPAGSGTGNVSISKSLVIAIKLAAARAGANS